MPTMDPTGESPLHGSNSYLQDVMGAFSSTVRWNPTSSFGIPQPTSAATRSASYSGGKALPSPGIAKGPRAASLIPISVASLNGSLHGGNSVSDTRSTNSASTTPSSSMHNSNITASPYLYDHALVGDWCAVQRRVASHPVEAMYIDRCRNTALHLACRRQPPSEVISALILADPAGPARATSGGMTPLHFACYCGAVVDVVQLLLESVPSASARLLGGAAAAEQTLAMSSAEVAQFVAVSGNIPRLLPLDRRARTPLHCCCAAFRSPSNRPDVVRALLTFDPNAATKPDERGRTAFSLILDDYAEEVEEVLRSSGSKTPAAESGIQDGLEPEGALVECWNIVCLLLRAAYHGTVIADDRRLSTTPQDTSASEVDLHHGRFRVVHAAMGVPECPLQLARLALAIHPAGVRDADEDLNLPLHVAARISPGPPQPRNNPYGPIYAGAFRRGSFIKTNSNSKLADNSSSSKRDALFRQSSASAFPPEKTTIVDDLIALYPEAASIPDGTGKLPLYIAVESGKPFTGGVEPILRAYPPAFDSGRVAHSSLISALSSSSADVRRETARTAASLSKQWNGSIDAFICELVQFVRQYGTSPIPPNASAAARRSSSSSQKDATGSNRHLPEEGSETGTVSSMPPSPDVPSVDSVIDVDENVDQETVGIQTSMLEALAGVLENARPSSITEKNNIPLSLTVGVEMLRHDQASVREAASRVVAAAVEILGASTAIVLVRRIVLNRSATETFHPASLEAEKLSDDGVRVGEDSSEDVDPLMVLDTETLDLGGKSWETTAAKHGRALACQRIALSKMGSAVQGEGAAGTFAELVAMVKSMMLDAEPSLRAVASVTMGTLLGRSESTATAGLLKDVRGSVLKCMRATEYEDVHLAIGRGLMMATKMTPHLFLCKAGMPLLDGALMLAVSGTPNVQKRFQDFLWLALDVADGDGRGLQAYDALAEGENGRIMMTLVAKNLSMVSEVDDELQQE